MTCRCTRPEWREIAEAPQDEMLLLWDERYPVIGWWLEDRWTDGEITLFPTHWMAIPEGPSDEGSS